MQESLVNVQPAFVADNQPSELAQPSQRALQLHHPSVLAQLLAAFYSFARNSGSDASLSQSTPAPLKVVPLVSMQLGRSLPSSSAKHPGLLDRLDSVNNIGESVGVVDVGWSAYYRERNSFGVDHNSIATLALRAGGRRTEFPLSVGDGPVRLAHSPPF
jgi:hypothetical protein